MYQSPTSGAKSELKTGKQEVPGTIPSCAYQPSHSEFSVVFCKTPVNTGLGSLRNTPMEGTPATGPGPTSGQLALILQQLCVQKFKIHSYKQIRY